MRRALSLLLATLSFPAATACGAPTGLQQLRAEVINRYPHDPEAFTQGLVWGGSTLFESTGLIGQSSLREVDLATGQVIRSSPLGSTLFGEGLALHDGQLIQLTWQAGVALVYDAGTFEPAGGHTYSGEGWGLCSDGTHLIMSNGSSTLRFRDPETFDEISSLLVTRGGAPVIRLNELEFVDGFIYANILFEDNILKIDPTTGAAVAQIDASGLLTPAEAADADVLNGIAYLPESGHFLLTGKRWPWVFEVEFVPAEEANGIVLGGLPASSESL